jgi:hypothetical protein
MLAYCAGVVPVDNGVYMCFASSMHMPPAQPCAIFLLHLKPEQDMQASVSLLVAESSAAGKLKVSAYHAEGASAQVANDVWLIMVIVWLIMVLAFGQHSMHQLCTSHSPGYWSTQPV